MSSTVGYREEARFEVQRPQKTSSFVLKITQDVEILQNLLASPVKHPKLRQLFQTPKWAIHKYLKKMLDNFDSLNLKWSFSYFGVNCSCQFWWLSSWIGWIERSSPWLFTGDNYRGSFKLRTSISFLGQ